MAFYNWREQNRDSYSSHGKTPSYENAPVYQKYNAGEPVSVTNLLQNLKGVVESAFSGTLRVVGEVSTLSLSKHCYFVLKDAGAVLSVSIWKSFYDKLPFKLQIGMKVVCTGRLNVYPPQGKVSLIVTNVEPVGVGAYQLALKQLEAKLRREGLFDPARKRPIPKMVRRVGVATSLNGAALRDFVVTLGKRCKRIDVVIAQTKVQGEDAANDVVKALRMLNDLAEPLKLDVIALIRGGGSVEDLWTFNLEPVVRAVANSKLPVVTGIGHEIDNSLCDLAADLHAVTPTAAAERIAIEDSVFAATLDDWERRMNLRMEQRVKFARERLDSIAKSRVFTDPFETIYGKRSKLLDELEMRLTNSIERKIANVQRLCDVLKERLTGRDPKAILARGYSFTQRADDMKILRSPDDVKVGQVIETTLAQGKIRSVVIE